MVKLYPSFEQYALESSKSLESLPVPVVKLAGETSALSIPIITIIGVEASTQVAAKALRPLGGLFMSYSNSGSIGGRSNRGGGCCSRYWLCSSSNEDKVLLFNSGRVTLSAHNSTRKCAHKVGYLNYEQWLPL